MNSENPQYLSLRNIFGKFATGVCAISYYGKNNKPKGITINSFTSVSLNPPLALWCIDSDSDTYEEIINKDKYIFNILSDDQLNIARLLSIKNNHSLNDIDFINHEFGPIFNKSIGWIACSKREIISAGDHSIIIGNVNNFEILNINKKPLIFWSGEFGKKLN
tara:strand:+ start:190 stop:678 length:489 start_codon:yes stop_codon:yes gene_type:complete